MPRYKYTAREKSGKKLTGQVEAPNPEEAAKLVRTRGYVVTDIRPSSFFFSFSLNRGVRGGELSSFTRQFATLITAGLPVTESLSILRVQASSNFQPIISQILADVEAGKPLSAGMAKFPKVFSETYVAIMKAGEKGGALDKVLTRLADNLEAEQEFRGKVRAALIYPIIIIVGMIAVSALMVLFVIPRLTSIYEQFDAELPLATRILTGFSGFAISFWPFILTALFVLLWGYKVYSKTERGRRRISRIVLRIPIIGELGRQIILTELTRTLSLLMSAGVPILDSLAISVDIVSNRVISDALTDVRTQVERGFPVSYAFAKHPEAFPLILSQTISVGEETGKMDGVLFKLSRVFESGSDQKLKALTAIIEPVVMIVLGVGVAFLLVSVILPIYNLTNTL